MPEVDLTEDKSYSNLTTMPRSATNILPEIFRESSIPWNFSTPYTLPRIIHSDAELGQVPLVFTGDAETINFMREVAEVEEGKRCDCCGRLITTPLWDIVCLFFQDHLHRRKPYPLCSDGVPIYSQVPHKRYTAKRSGLFEYQRSGKSRRRHFHLHEHHLNGPLE